MGKEQVSPISTLSANSILASLATPTQTTVLSRYPPGEAKGKQAEKPTEEKALPAVVISPVFKMVFIAVVGLTVLSLAVSIILSFQDPLSKAQEGLLESCSTTWKLGFGAIIGLIGGKRV